MSSLRLQALAPPHALPRALRTLIVACLAALCSLAVLTSAASASTAGVSVHFASATGTTEASNSFYVDVASIGGRCSDARRADQNTIATPWCTLGRALQAAPAGATIYLRAGSYPTATVAGFAPSATVTVSPYPGEAPVVQGLNLGAPGAVSDHLALVGLKFTNPGISLTNVSDIRIADDEFAMVPRPPSGCTGGPANTAHCQSNTPNAVLLSPPASHLTIDGNYFHDGSMAVAMHDGTPPHDGVPLATTFQNIAIDGNTFSRMGDVVIQVENFENVDISGNTWANDRLRTDVDPECHCDAVHVIGGGDKLMVAGNLVYGGRGFLIQPVASTGVNCQPTCFTVTNATIENNALFGPDFGIRILSSPGIKVLNNTVEGPPGVDDGLSFLYGIPATTHAVVANNLLSYFEARAGNTFAVENYNDVQQAGTGMYAPPHGSHDIAGTPQFIDASDPTWNVGLAPGSVGVGAGSGNYAPAVDVAGWQSRSPVNLGADGAEQPGASAANLAHVGASPFSRHALTSQGLTGPPQATAAIATAAAKVSTRGRTRVISLGHTLVVDTGLLVSCDRHQACVADVVLHARGRHHHGGVSLRLARSLSPGSAHLLTLRLSRRAIRRILAGRRSAVLTVRLVAGASARARHVAL